MNSSLRIGLLLGWFTAVPAIAQVSPSPTQASTAPDALAAQVAQSSRNVPTSVSSPEERVRQMEAWQGANNASLERMRAARRQAMAQQFGKPDSVAPRANSSSTGLAAELAALLHSMNAAPASSEQRIQQLDEFLARHQNELAAQPQIRRPGNSAPDPEHPAATPAMATTDPGEVRVRVLKEEIRNWIASLAPLSPEARVATVDAAQDTFQAREREISALRQKSRSLPSSPVSPAFPTSTPSASATRTP